MTPDLPISSALDEAKPESLNDITNMDPEKWNDGHIERMTVMLRAHAVKYAQMKNEPKAPKPKAESGGLLKSVPKGSANPKGLTIDDLGL